MATRNVARSVAPVRPALAGSNVVVSSSDLRIEITKWWRVSYFGTAQQLTDEGLLPVGKALPIRGDFTVWSDDQSCFDLRRRKPPGTGRTGRWIEGDYWRLSVEPKDHSGVDLGLLEAQQRVRDALLSSSPQGRQIRRAWYAAAGDGRFQAFKAFVIGGAV